MGRLTYGSSGLSIEIDDRALAHLQIVIGTKLRRREPLFFSWRDGTESGGGRGTIWIDAAIELHFGYSTAVRSGINRKWLEKLAVLANTPQGLQLVDEPVDDTGAVPVREPEPAVVEAVGLAPVGQ